MSGHPASFLTTCSLRLKYPKFSGAIPDYEYIPPVTIRRYTEAEN